jgi:TrmH family RNA methyltransferase
MDIITSSQNPLIKEIKQLGERKHREDRGLFFIEGIRFVEEALNENADVYRLLISERLEEVGNGRELIKKIRDRNLETTVLSDKLFREISDTENPQGVLAVLRMKGYGLENLEGVNTADNLYIILDGIQDPGNMGTVIRTADAAGAAAVIALRGCVDIYNPKVLRATMGSVFHLPVFACSDSGRLFKMLKEKSVKLVAAHLEGSMNHYELDMRKDVALIVGNEAGGIGPEAAAAADVLVRIPMPGRAESLNASIAAGVLIYEAVRQRISDK